MQPTTSTRFRILSAWLCLLAALSLFAPFAEAAWSAHSAACCTGDHCPIPEHQHSKPQAPAAECEHHGASGMTPCRMNCCDSQSHLLLASLAFVLPIEISIASAAPSQSAQPASRANSPLRFSEVLAPPPRPSALRS